MSAMRVPPPQAVNNVEGHQFEIRVDDQFARLQYKIRDGVIDLFHTEVPAVLEGQGLENALARAALDFAAARKLRVIPTCPFVRAFLKRHAEYATLTERTDD
jgi:predicted GNAT family acetyltransferase